MKQKIKVAVAHNYITQNVQDVMAGISEYAHNKGDWQIIIWPDNTLESLRFLKEHGCKGAFVSVQTSTKAQQILQIGMPVIALSTLQDMSRLPFISADNQKVAELAYEHLSNKKFKNYGFFGLTESKWTYERSEHFSELITRDGGILHRFNERPITTESDMVPFPKLCIDMMLTQGQEDLIQWLRNLPKPIAILASCDIVACYLSNIANEQGFTIPDEIAIMGVDNDSALCNICNPPLSSVALNLKKAGYEAATLLDQIISGHQQLQGQRVTIVPEYVKSRGSTDILAVDDPEIVMALKYIRANSNKPMQVEDIANHLCVSKRSLQLKFQKALGRAIHDEIILAHLEIAKTLLIETDLPVDAIAEKSGFSYTSNMRRAFLTHTNMLPRKFRQHHRVQD
jgi:LacI family transcriptional regulator